VVIGSRRHDQRQDKATSRRSRSGKLKLVNARAGRDPDQGRRRADAHDRTATRRRTTRTVRDRRRCDLEGSNVNVVESMVGMIALARQFEMQMKLLSRPQSSNEQRAAQLLSLKG
jgi:flagellar basal-body rod protein FlgF